ncbi:MAG: hypothetical protein DHS20C20_21310 [Ardenticatenaceae bacterium]|nr:MAG: hypothetical protein DHS20C20_21310 [Ardenticatenaceae bacterium]
MGKSVMDGANPESVNKKYNQQIIVGCGLIAILFFFGLAFGLVELVQRDRQTARYPGASTVAVHSNYTGFPRSYSWDDTFRTNDGFHAVYEWYSITFDMGAESRANGTCILLETDNQHLLVHRFMTVTICGTQNGQLVFVDRTTRIK